MKNFLRFLLGVGLLPACWAALRSLYDALLAAAGASGGLTVEAVSLLGGMAAFALSWMALSHPVKTYVLGHELTHAIWGVAFGAHPSDVRVTEKGGSVRLSKTNVLITLAPYFFPFYTFVVILAAIITYAFLRELPCLPRWLFLVGFTWAFHILFTIETLMQSQPDVKTYGRLFSWTFIVLANIALVLVWLAATTSLSFARLGGILYSRFLGVYVGTAAALWNATVWSYEHLVGLCSRTS